MYVYSSTIQNSQMVETVYDYQFYVSIWLSHGEPRLNIICGWVFEGVSKEINQHLKWQVQYFSINPDVNLQISFPQVVSLLNFLMAFWLQGSLATRTTLHHHHHHHHQHSSLKFLFVNQSPLCHLSPYSPIVFILIILSSVSNAVDCSVFS